MLFACALMCLEKRFVDTSAAIKTGRLLKRQVFGWASAMWCTSLPCKQVILQLR